MNKRIALSATVFVTLASGNAHAYDAANGQQLVNGNCLECHGTEVYTRDDRRVKSRNSLTTQVQRCELALDLKWFDDEVGDAAEYLNQNYYKFGK